MSIMAHTESVLREQFLQGMSRVASTVTVVTTAGDAGMQGVTVSAMSSVSADGERPTLLVCVHHRSAAAEAIRNNGRFAVNILRAEEATVSDHFAGRLRREDGDKFACTDWEAGPTGQPHIAGALAAFDCVLLSEQRIGTHHLFIGGVEELYLGESGDPLIYSNRQYGRPASIQ